MAAGTYNFTIEQGATFTRQFKYKDANGTAIDLVTESHTARMDIRTSIGGDLISSFSTVGSGLSISNPNIISLTIPAEDTASYTFNNAVYDLELVNSSGVVTRLLQGKIKLSKEVTTSS